MKSTLAMPRNIYCNECEHCGPSHYCQPKNKYTGTNDVFDKISRNKNGKCEFFKPIKK